MRAESSMTPNSPIVFPAEIVSFVPASLSNFEIKVPWRSNLMDVLGAPAELDLSRDWQQFVQGLEVPQEQGE